MGISQIRKYCFDSEEEQSLSNHYQTIAKDYSTFEK